jgi:Uma2 family endonuclease
MALREKPYTADEFFEIAGQPENEDKRLELDDGVIVDMGSSSQLNTVTAARIVYFLNASVIPNDLGYVTGADGGYKLGEKRARIPDVAFVSKARVPKLKGLRFPLAPDLAVEVVSPDEDIFKKAREYLYAGTMMVWAVYADEKVVYVMRADSDGSIRSVPYGVNDTLDGGDVLPNFALPVRDIFPE